MDALEASVSSQLDEDTGSAKPKPNDKPTSLSERDKGNQSARNEPDARQALNQGFLKRKARQKSLTLAVLVPR
jgi:hypothetical protein